MEKYDYIVKSSEIRKLVEKRMYQKALQIMETMDINKIKVLPDLSIFAEVYMQTEHYDEAERILLRLREKSGGRRIIYQLIKLAIKRKNVEDAEYYYNEFVEAAPRDPDKYILRYRIDKMEKKDYPILIASLKELKEYDYTEKWAYELAKVYHRAGMVEECVNECSDIILWFGDGVVVEKARMLKNYHVENEASVPHAVPLMHTEVQFDFLEQVEIETQSEPTSMEEPVEAPIEDTAYVEQPIEAPVGESAYVEQLIEEPVEEVSEVAATEQEEKEDNQFKTQDISEITKLLNNYYDEEKQVMVEQLVEEQLAGIQPEEEQVEEVEEAEEVEEQAEEEPIEEPQEAKEVYEEKYSDRVPFQIDTQKELFGRFYSIASIRLQVVNLVNDMLKEPIPFSFAIAGTAKCGKTTLAKCFIKLLHELEVFPYKKVAKISSDRLNDIKLEDHYERLQNGYLIVEEAGGLQTENQLQLIKMLRELRGRILVILEDTQENLQMLFRNYPMLNSYVRGTIRIEAYGKKELYDYAVNFFNEKKFDLEEDADVMLELLCEELESKEVVEERPAKLLNSLEKTLENLERRGLQELVCEQGKQYMDDSNINRILASDFGNV